jgi:hypothetical protein
VTGTTIKIILAVVIYVMKPVSHFVNNLM